MFCAGRILLLRFLILTCTLICYSSFCNSQNAAFDSLKNLVDTYTTEDSVRVNFLIDITAYYTVGDINKNLPLIEEAIAISEKIGYEEGKGIALNAFSKYYFIKGEYDLALIYALDAVELLEMLGDKRNLIITNNNLANIYADNSESDKSLVLHLKNVELVKNDSASANKAGMYFYVAKTYQVQGDLDAAEDYYLQAREIASACGFETGVAIAEGSLGNVYSEKKEYEKAILFLNRTLEFSQNTDQIGNMAATYYGLASCYQYMKEYERALVNLDSAISVYKSLNSYKMLENSYQTKFDCLVALERFQEANECIVLRYVMVDSMYSERKLQTIKEMQTKYETDKKETEIIALSQQATIQALEIKQKNIGIVIGLVVLLFLSFGTYFIYRQHTLKRKQGQVELEQRFLRSQLNPHFIFNALQAIQNFMLKNEAKMAALYLTKFSKLMREILENSREEYISVDSEIEMLANYLDIHKLRLNDSFDYRIIIDDNIESEVDTIPPMFVQPFVENAIEHGISHAEGRGLIELSFKKKGEYISIEVKDNGGGVIAITDPKEHKSLASTIIKERMVLFNKSLKDKIQLVIDEMKNEKGQKEGMRVELKVPYGVG